MIFKKLFNEGEEMDFSKLLTDRVAIHARTKALLGKTAKAKQTSKEVEVIKLISEEARYWEFVIAATGFMQASEETGGLTTRKTLDRIRDEPVQAHTYFDPITTLPTAQVLSAGSEVEELVAPTQVDVIAFFAAALPCLMACNSLPPEQRADCRVKCFDKTVAK